MTMNANIVIGE